MIGKCSSISVKAYRDKTVEHFRANCRMFLNEWCVCHVVPKFQRGAWKPSHVFLPTVRSLLVESIEKLVRQQKWMRSGTSRSKARQLNVIKVGGTNRFSKELHKGSVDRRRVRAVVPCAGNRVQPSCALLLGAKPIHLNLTTIYLAFRPIPPKTASQRSCI